MAAQRLFAQRGIDGVSVRDIVAAAGQRNNGSLNYYFRTKEALVLELIVEGGRLIDESRNAYLDRLEADGGPRTVREVIEALVWPAIGLAETDREENTYIRFITVLEMNHRKLFRGLIDKKVVEVLEFGLSPVPQAPCPPDAWRAARIAKSATGVPRPLSQRFAVGPRVRLSSRVSSRTISGAPGTPCPT